MIKLYLGLSFLALSFVRAADDNLVGIYAPEKLGSRLELTADGTFSLESVGEVAVWFLGGSWKKIDRVLILSLNDEIARYTIADDGKKLSLIHKLKAASRVEYHDAALATEYKKEPNQPAQHNAGSRSPSNDSPLSATPSTPAPRG